jgi:hypothetical protein
MLYNSKDACQGVCHLVLVLFILWTSSLTPVWAAPPQRDYWPTVDWRISFPEAEGMDSHKLLKVIPFIVNNLPDIQSLLMVRNGYLVFENYYGLGMPNRQDTIHSVTKSVTSALVGIARDKGLLTGAINEFRVRVDQCRINGDKAKFFGEIETNMGRIPWRCRT